MRKLIIIAFYFNQVNEIASKRLRALAKYLPQFGWEPIVIVPDLGFIPSENDDLDCRVIYTEYEDMFTHFSKRLPLSKKGRSRFVNNDADVNSGYDGNSKANSTNNLKGDSLDNSDVLKDSSSFSNPLVSKAVSIAGEIFAYPDGMKYWHDSAFEMASKIIENEKIDAVISSSWPITSHTIAKDLKRQYGIFWIADLRDLWNMNPYISHTFIRSYFERRLELKTFNDADALTTTTDLAAKTLATLHPENLIVPILSGYDNDDMMDLNGLLEGKNFSVCDGEDLRDLNGLLEDNGISSDSFSHLNSNKLKFIYAGSLYGGKRDPSFLFKAIRQLGDEGKIDLARISIEFYGDCVGLEELALKYGLLESVDIGGRISHSDVLKKQMGCDVLLLISWNDEKERMFIPGKIYEYFALKKPVLSIGYKEGSLKDLIEETKVGCHVSDLESTKKAVLEFYNEFIEKGAVDFNSDINIENYSMENMAKKFADLLNEISNK